MIKANELRIGNTIQEKQFPLIHSNIEQLHSTHAITSCSDSIAYEDLFGVPLTSELLDKYGFVVDSPSNKNCFVNSDLVIFKSNPEIFAGDIPDNAYHTGCGRMTVTFQYLHQLQNLYFAITNEELQVNL